MARYFFHLRDGSDQVLDPEGIELPDLEAAKAKVLLAARDTLSNDIREGKLDLRYRIEVEDSDGNMLYSLPLKDAFQVITS